MVLQRKQPSEVKGLKLDPIDSKTMQQSADILKDIENDGVEGFRKHAERLGDLKPGEDFVITKDKLKAAFESLSKEDQEMLKRTADRIRAFAQVQMSSVKEVTTDIPGGKAGQKLAPVAAAGCYAPGGRYPLPSSVLMTAITARVAGVEKVWVASPKPVPVTLAAAYLADVDALLAVGGPQAIGAFAYGMEGIVPQCNAIVGPGNRWVTAAKQIVSGAHCTIDMLAGPSECLVLCDETANPAVIAADLLAQAEHDTDALPILVTTSEPMIEAVNKELKKQLETLPTAGTASVSAAKGISVFCETMEEAIKITDIFAPEHLEVMTANSQDVADKISNYGGLFIGERSAEVFGDYGAGPNHVLPTSGSARHTGGLSVFMFLRVRTWMRIDEKNEESDMLVRDSAQLARLEGLEGHARAADLRLELGVKKQRTE
mmetsp:Transcript_8076/g.9268  ORF Transcript_8076/g.9268 Transcript_8076/m.9268 type:complete len:431 (+) Transcript_8076:208-1500(+)